MDIRTGIIEAANALGISPADLATVISYETGGTFNPTEAGPTTKWGQHRGFIQFGEDQARRYNIDWNDPIGSQLGANGAVVRYLRDTGVRPGSSLLDIYSAINAGGVGRYSATDAGAGGAPGTVADKVAGMGAHQQKAMALLGGEFQPSTGPTFASATTVDPSLAEAFSDPNRYSSPLADVVSSRVGERPLSVGTGDVIDRKALAPAFDFASAVPAPRPPPVLDTPAPLAAAGNLADLFKVKDIGQPTAIDPRTQAAPVTARRRTYG